MPCFAMVIWESSEFDWLTAIWRHAGPLSNDRRLTLLPCDASLIRPCATCSGQGAVVVVAPSGHRSTATLHVKGCTAPQQSFWLG